MHIVIFEDEKHQNFYPLSLTKPLWELRSGMFSFKERYELFLKNYAAHDQFYYFTRKDLAPVFSEKYPGCHINDYSVLEKGDFLFIDATLYPDYEIISLDPGEALYCDNRLIAARIQQPIEFTNSIQETLQRVSFKKKEKQSQKLQKINYIWELVHTNAERITEDYALAQYTGTANNSVTIVGDPGLVYIEDTVKIDPFVVLDATHGPVIIKSGTEINPFTRIEGPAYIGNNCIVLGAKIREGTSIGDCCRVGGEIEESIIHGYSNKYHDGFIGHAYIGEWVNMGAMTTNSDLKNNYKTVSVYLSTGKADTGSPKVGCFMGDFVKTSIGTLINTGASIGTGAMLVHSGALAPAHIGPFKWYAHSEIKTKDWEDEFIASAQRMTARRNVDFTSAMEKFYRVLCNTYNR